MKVLLVEDNPDHAFLSKRSLEEQGIRYINHVENGEEALAYLKCEGEYASSVRPDLILLDLKMPKMDGLEVLAVIKKDDSLKSIPVVMLTTSDSEEDRKSAYLHNVNSYVVKPMELNDFQEKIGRIVAYWQEVDVGAGR